MEVEVHLGVGDVHISLQCNVLTMQCFPILYDAIFSRCFWQNMDLMFWTMIEKIKNIMLKMHIWNVFQTII